MTTITIPKVPAVCSKCSRPLNGNWQQNPYFPWSVPVYSKGWICSLCDTQAHGGVSECIPEDSKKSLGRYLSSGLVCFMCTDLIGAEDYTMVTDLDDVVKPRHVKDCCPAEYV